MKRLNNFAAVILMLTSIFPLNAWAGGVLGKRIVLENGMVVLLSERHDLPMVTVSLAVRAGEVNGPSDKPGLSSITADLLMQGTTRRTADQISREIDYIGGTLTVSGDSDFATIKLRVLKKDIRKGLDLLADILMNPAFSQHEIDRKVKEMLAEIQRRKEEPSIVAREVFYKTVFGGHAYGRTGDDISAFLNRLERRDILDFYSFFYRPNNTVMAIVGDVREGEIIGLLTEYFQGWRPKPQAGIQPVPLPALDSLVVKKIARDVTQANIVMGHLGISREDPDFYAVMVMNYILGGGGFSSRLMDNIRDNRGLAYDVSSGFDAMKEPGAFSVEIQTKNESANEVIDEVLKEIRRIASEPVSESELADAKAYLTGSFPLRMDTYAKIALMLTSIEIYNLGLDYPERYSAMINAVSRDDVLRVAKKYLHPDSMVIVVVANQSKAKLRY